MEKNKKSLSQNKIFLKTAHLKIILILPQNRAFVFAFAFQIVPLCCIAYLGKQNKTKHICKELYYYKTSTPCTYDRACMHVVYQYQLDRGSDCDNNTIIQCDASECCVHNNISSSYSG